MSHRVAQGDARLAAMRLESEWQICWGHSVPRQEEKVVQEAAKVSLPAREFYAERLFNLVLFIDSLLLEVLLDL